jgi:hypothetical protein
MLFLLFCYCICVVTFVAYVAFISSGVVSALLGSACGAESFLRS